jgi:Peptidase family M1 domain
MVCALAAGAASATAGVPDGRVVHSMTVSLAPETHMLTVTDHVRLAARPADGLVDFVLNAALRISSSTPEVHELPLGADVTFFGINGSADTTARQVGLKRYRARLAPGQVTLTMTYGGAVEFGLSDQKEEYTRGFRESAGMLGTEGVYLTGASFWYPSFNRDLLDFDLDVVQPSGWQVISQGNGTSRDAGGHSRWVSGGPMDEIDLVGGPLQVWRGSAGPVETLVYLHERDDGLAGKYLAATAQYLEMYRGLIGPYPYGKFALVENFWETGYGMPTFTLLGHDIIRFPFIITSSYPHEILHNWWGNSVFVDYESGNWCEGLTAYLADHLIQEQNGAGAEYRRSTLQKYRDYVREGRDFPLTAFRSRESASTEAVGYGKALMAYHMLRLQIGDDLFRQVLRRFYADFKGRRASFADFEKTAETVSGRDLTRFFREWIGRAGAPVLAAEVTSVRPETSRAGGGFVVEGRLRQTQGGEAFAVDVPVVVQTATATTREVVHLTTAEQRFAIASAGVPLMVRVDPWFDVFRKLDPRETPPSVGQIFGEPKVLAVLPSQASAAEIHAWRDLFNSWQSESHAIEVKLDTEVSDIPPDRAVWIAGRANRWASRLFAKGRAGLAPGESSVEIDGTSMKLANHTLVLTARHPHNAEKAIGFLATDSMAALPALGRKLPHYGKYSYLGFEGDDAVNVLKGQWQESDSPLAVDVRALGARAAGVPETTLPRPGPLPPDVRKALAALPAPPVR